MKPTLSIIVPVYNVKEYLDKCILSILNQTYSDFELILVDDGSTDGSGEICDRYKERDDRIHVYHQTNHGQSAARNFALKISIGEYLGFVDSDDWIERDMFCLMMKPCLEQNADIVTCRLQIVDEHGNITEVTGYENIIMMDKIQATSDILKDELMRSYPVNKIYRRKLFDGVEFPLNRYFEDTATIYKVIYHADKVVTIPYIGYNYQYNPNSTCNKKNIDYLKQVKREYDNALAFGERYMFCKEDENLSGVRIICADKAYMRMRSFIHLQVHKNFRMTEKQEKDIDVIMKSFTWNDLKNFSVFQRMDYIAYRYCKQLYYKYLRFLSLIHPMSRDL